MNHYQGTLTDQIIAYESGELTEAETIELFQRLVDCGLAWKLQGTYGRMAAHLIKAGKVTIPGKENADVTS